MHGRIGQLLIVDLIRFQVGDFKALRKCIHIEAQGPVAVSPNQQTAGFGAGIDLRIDDPNHGLAVGHHGQRGGDKGLMPDGDGAEVESQLLAKLPGPGTSRQDDPAGLNVASRGSHGLYGAVRHVDAGHGRTRADRDAAVPCPGRIGGGHRTRLDIAITRRQENALGAGYVQRGHEFTGLLWGQQFCAVAD